MAAAVLLNLIQFGFFYGRAKKILASWNGEDEADSERIDRMLSITAGISSLLFILGFFLLGAVWSAGAWHEMDGISGVGLIAFIALTVETIVMQQRCVNAAKQMNPERAGSVYDMDFHRKWMDSSDEAEKIMAGECAYQAFRVTNQVCAVLAVVLAVITMIFHIGCIPSLSVCLVWAVNEIVYLGRYFQLSRRGTRIL